MIISADREKAFDSTYIHDKNSRQSRSEGSSPMVVKSTDARPTSNTTLNGEH